MKKEIKIQKNRGMSYVELIVVLSIFSVMSSVAIYNYGEFQAKIDIKNLASDIALKIVEAQKSSVSGKFPPLAQQSGLSSTWKPSYGVFFNLAWDNRSFIYYADLNNDVGLANYDCAGTDECVARISITNNNSISALNVYYQNDTTAYSLPDLTINFKRPNADAIIRSTPIPVPPTSPIDYVQISITSPKGATAQIKMYPSGRIQVN